MDCASIGAFQLLVSGDSPSLSRIIAMGSKSALPTLYQGVCSGATCYTRITHIGKLAKFECVRPKAQLLFPPLAGRWRKGL